MKNLFLAAAIALGSALAVVPTLSDAKRFGGGSSSGMQRQMPNSAPAKPAAPQQAAPATAPGGAAAPAAAGRSWMGPIAGLAAGLGIAALMSHLGMGEAFGNFLMLALLAVAAVFIVRLLMRRFGTPAAAPGKLASAGTAPTAPAWNKPAEAPVMARTQDSGAPTLSADGSTRLAPLGSGSGSAPLPTAAAVALPAGFDTEGFERIAKMIFIRMQAANDKGDLNDLRSFTTPEMFAVARIQLQDRGDTGQTTDVVKVDAEVVDFEQAGDRQVVSVRYHGQIREDLGGPLQDFDEIWHLQRWGDAPSWAIAGIQQRQ
jgi:predicted lipid-binding transport protein (Tim44 family)